MIALLEQQRVDRRPAGRPAPSGGRRWEATPTDEPRRRRMAAADPARRGSERLDEIIRLQAPRRTHEAPEGSPRRIPHGSRPARTSLRVRRRSVVAWATGAFLGEVRDHLVENWRLWAAVTLGALTVLGLLAVMLRLDPSGRSPAIALEGAGSSEEMLLQAIVPQGLDAADAIEPAVVSILSVREHVVKEGETLSGIAAIYRLRLGTLIDFNRIRDARAIPVGKKLSIPNVDGLRYAVRRGDTLGRIGQRYGVSLNALRDWNDLQTDLIRPGQQLFIPGASLSEDDINAVLGKLFIYPTRGQLTSRFGMRMSPIARVELFHNGIDLANRTGTPVVASRAGRVAAVDLNATYGRVVLVSHSGGYQTMYAHLDTILVRRGQSVSQGQQLATMGSTGASVGPHLHFTVFKNQVPVDPLGLLH